MATYKVIQDIEAEDKLIGWMTPRQTIYAAIVAVSAFVCFLFITKGAWFLAIPFLPHMILFIVLAGPFVHDQPSEVWLLAKIQFFLKPRRRIWDQTGFKDLVTITVPKKIERHLTDGLSQTEVKSRLQALANTIDSRGWAVKNINTNLYAQPSYVLAGSDRLVNSNSLPREVPNYEVYASDDILDEQSNPTAQNMRQMVTQSAQAHRQQLITQMQQYGQPQAPAASPAPTNQWFVDPATQATTLPAPITAQNNIPDASDQALLDEMKSRKSQANDHLNLRGIAPLGPAPAPTAPKPVVNQAAVAQLAQNNDLNIATIAREVNRPNTPKPLDDNEVVVSLR